MFSPIVGDRWVSSSATVRPLAGIGEAPISRSTSPAACERQPGDGGDERLKIRIARDEVGLGVDLDDARRRGLRRRRRPAPRRRPGPTASRRPTRPFLRSQSTAPPCRRRVSVSAFLQSIMPALVFSRSALTRLGRDLGHLQALPAARSASRTRRVTRVQSARDARRAAGQSIALRPLQAGGDASAHRPQARRCFRQASIGSAPTVASTDRPAASADAAFERLRRRSEIDVPAATISCWMPSSTASTTRSQ